VRVFVSQKLFCDLDSEPSNLMKGGGFIGQLNWLSVSEDGHDFMDRPLYLQLK
jgi:hypothetical protein